MALNSLKARPNVCTQLRKHHLNPDLTLDGTRIEVVPEFKFLGLLFDPQKKNARKHYIFYAWYLIWIVCVLHKFCCVCTSKV